MNYPVKYFCIPVICENDNVRMSCCSYFNKSNKCGCYACGLFNVYQDWNITPICCYSDHGWIFPYLLCCSIEQNNGVVMASSCGLWIMMYNLCDIRGCGIGPIGCTKKNCFPLFFNININNFSIFNRIFCLGVNYSNENYELGCALCLPTYIIKKKTRENNKNIVKEKGVKYLMPWNVSKMI